MQQMLKEKRQAFEALLQAMEAMKDAVTNERVDELGAAAEQQKLIMSRIDAIDRENAGRGNLEHSPAPLSQIEDLKALIVQMEDLNRWLTTTVGTRMQQIQEDLGMLRRRAGAAADYRRQADAKF